MADEKKLRELIAGLAAEGIQVGDIMKALKTAKDDGVIKSKGRGKLPENDPLRIVLRDAILGMKVDQTVEDHKFTGSLLSLIAESTTKSDATSLMVTLDDNWKVNFVKNVPKEKKEKQEKKETQPSDFSEPAVV